MPRSSTSWRWRSCLRGACSSSPMQAWPIHIGESAETTASLARRIAARRGCARADAASSCRATGSSKSVARASRIRPCRVSCAPIILFQRSWDPPAGSEHTASVFRLLDHSLMTGEPSTRRMDPPRVLRLVRVASCRLRGLQRGDDVQVAGRHRGYPARIRFRAVHDDRRHRCGARAPSDHGDPRCNAARNRCALRSTLGGAAGRRHRFRSAAARRRATSFDDALPACDCYT